MNYESGAVLVVSGPSGAGKSTLINKVANEIGPYYFSISTTTRRIRENEQEGVHYHFVDKETFQKGIEDDQFLEYAVVHGNYYGTSIEPVKQALKEGKLVIFDIDVQGNDTVQNRLGDITTSVFVTTPSLSELKKRLHKRATDDREVIEKRVHLSKREVQRIGEYDYLIVNDDIEDAAQKLVLIARASRLKVPSQRINEFIAGWETD